jgi:putative phosphoribosyl transferase
MKEVIIPAGKVQLNGLLTIPKDAKGIVLFAHGSGSSRFSKRNQFVAQVLNEANIATLLFDLLVPDEEAVDEFTREFRFDIPFLADRLIYAAQWTKTQNDLSIGFFGASTGGGAALVAAAKIPEQVKAVVSRGGRPDLAGSFLKEVKAPTLLIVGGDDIPVIEMNKEALSQLNCEKKLEIVPGATHLFEEPGTLEIVAEMAKKWFLNYFNTFNFY